MLLISFYQHGMTGMLMQFHPLATLPGEHSVHFLYLIVAVSRQNYTFMCGFKNRKSKKHFIKGDLRKPAAK